MYDVARAKRDPQREVRRASQHLADEITERVVETVNRKVAEKVGKQAEKLHQRLDGESLDRLASHLDALDVWTRGAGSGRKPRFSRDDIAATAVRICDAEGFDALSMRRLAQELGAGTMTLYHYVQTKDELLTLVNDAVMAEVLIPADTELPGDWRAALAMIAERTRASLQRHPWLFDIVDDPPIGPNTIRHFDQTLSAVSGLGLSLADQLDIVSFVDEYVFGHCIHARNSARPDSADDAGWFDGLAAYMSDLLTTGEYPQLQRMADEAGGLEAALSVVDEHSQDDARFTRNLERLLDGIEADLRRRGRK